MIAGKNVVIESSKRKHLIQEYKNWINYRAIPYEQYNLTPSEINMFLQMTVKYDSRGCLGDSPGRFINELIIQSYHAGHTNFEFNTHILTEKIHELGVGIGVNKKRPIRIDVNGDVGNECGIFAGNINLNISGNVGSKFGHKSCNSLFNVQGNAGELFGYGSEKSEFVLTGTSDPRYCGTGAISSIFKTPNRKTLNQFLGCISGEYDHHPGNRIVFIHKDGTEEIVRDYHDKQ